MRDRVFGTENEYGALIIENSSGKETCRPVKKPTDTLHISREKFSRLGLISNSVQSSVWLHNGGLIYVDCGTHPEYASPECRRAIDLVRFNKAGEELICRAFPQCKIFKDNCAPPADSDYIEVIVDGLISYGSHESYLVFGIEDFSTRGFLDSLAPFLASRQIIDGSGFVDDCGNMHLSQRAKFIFTLAGSNTLNSRSIINLRKEDLTGTRTDLRRLHLVVGDANLMETAIFLKIGSTSLVLSMIEDNCAPNFDMNANWPMVLKEISENAYGKAKVAVFPNGDRFSALDIQWIYCQAARKYVSRTSFESEESEHEARAVCRMWEKAIDALWSNDMSWLVGRLDHATLRYLFMVEEKRAGKGLSVNRKKMISQNYRKVNRGENMSKLLSDKLKHARLLTDAQIADALVNPPKDTRAALRARFLRTLSAAQKKCPAISGAVGWFAVVFGKNTASINNPLCFADPGDNFRNILEELGKIARGELTYNPRMTHNDFGYPLEV